jgi:AcrR family transcriptional regulator
VPRLTRPRILDAALTLVRRDGLDALTMRALANELGVTATALYYHYTGRDELLGALVTHSSSRLIATIDTAAPWEDQIIELVTAIADELTQYPDLAVWIMTTQARQPPVLAIHEEILRILATTDIHGSEAVYLKGAVFRLLIGHIVLAAADEGPAWSRVPKRFIHLRETAQAHRTTNRSKTLQRALEAVLGEASPRRDRRART